MKSNQVNRRQFLRGAGTWLALPLLPSLLPRSTWAAIVKPEPHFVGILSMNGQWKSNFLPTASFYDPSNMSVRATKSVPGGTITVRGRSLNEISGNLSPVLGALTPHKSKMTLFHGITIDGSSHNSACVMTASMQRDNDCTDKNGLPPYWGTSVDQVLSRSSAVYPNGIPARNLASLVLADPYICRSIEYPYMSWYQGQFVPHVTSPAALWNNILKGPFASAGGSTTTTQAKDARVRALNAVFADYQDAKSPRRNISSADSQRLESFMGRLNEVAKELDKAPVTVTVSRSCSAPPQSTIDSSGANYRAMWDTYSKLVVASFQCGLSNVAAMRLDAAADSGAQGTFHETSHLPKGSGEGATLPYQQWIAQRVKLLADELQNAKDVDGSSLLDNSVVLWGNELGYDTPGDHTLFDTPVLTIGNLGGRLRSGEMLSFHSSMGANHKLTYNSVLESIMQAAGVTDYPTQVIQTYGGTQVRGFGQDVSKNYGYLPCHYVGGPLPYWFVG
ncbi:MAG: DUF1552 domain-containing protein [Bdellovibrionales bacterium]